MIFFKDYKEMNKCLLACFPKTVSIQETEIQTLFRAKVVLKKIFQFSSNIWPRGPEVTVRRALLHAS